MTYNDAEEICRAWQTWMNEDTETINPPVDRDAYVRAHDLITGLHDGAVTCESCKHFCTNKCDECLYPDMYDNGEID